VHEALVEKNFARDTSALTSAFCDLNDWSLQALAIPLVDITVDGTKPLRIRMICNAWDELPPSVELLTPEGQPWNGAIPGGIFHAGPHPETQRPFICMRGIREYHRHPSHSNERWDSYRGKEGMNIVGLLMQLSRAWRKSYPRVVPA
jgi:hypothetical protein